MIADLVFCVHETLSFFKRLNVLAFEELFNGGPVSGLRYKIKRVITWLTVQPSGNNVSVLILSSAHSSVGIDTGLTPKNVVRPRRGR